MNAIARRLRNTLLTCLFLLPAAGCASMQMPSFSSGDIAQQRRQREEDIVREFEARRDFAEYQAAVSCWNQRDLEGCRQRLQVILERAPGHREAQLLLAELYLAEGRIPDAFDQAERALHNHPDDARAQYTMGLLLDATGRPADALNCYQRAATLEPESEVYAVSCRTALEPGGRAEVAAGSAGNGSLAVDEGSVNRFPVFKGDSPIFPTEKLGQSPACVSLVAQRGRASRSKARIWPRISVN